MIGAAMTTNPRERELYGDFPWKCLFMGGDEAPDGTGDGPVGVFFCWDREQAEKWVRGLKLQHPNPDHPLLVEPVEPFDPTPSFEVAGLFIAFVEHFVSLGYDVEPAGDLAIESMNAFRKYTGLPPIEDREVWS